MVNPRQRSKKRSGTFRPVQHSKHAKKNLKKQPRMSGMDMSVYFLEIERLPSDPWSQDTAGVVGQAQDGETKVRRFAPVFGLWGAFTWMF